MKMVYDRRYYDADFDGDILTIYTIVKSKNNTRKERRILRRASRLFNDGRPLKYVAISHNGWILSSVLQKLNHINRNRRIYPPGAFSEMGGIGFEGESTHPGR